MILLLLLVLCIPATQAKPGRERSVDIIIRTPPEARQKRVMLVLPPKAQAGRERFARQAFEQVTAFLRRYDFVVPSWLQINHFIKEQGLTAEDYPRSYHALAQVFKAEQIFFLDIQRVHFVKKINPAGLLASGILITGYGRYVTAEYRLDIYTASTHTVESLPAVERSRDYALGLVQTSERLALDTQTQSLSAMLTQYARQEILRPKGYILEPMERTFVDSKGFQ